MTNYMPNGKAMIIPLTVRLVKKIKYKYGLYKISQHFPKLYERSVGNIKV